MSCLTFSGLLAMVLAETAIEYPFKIRQIKASLSSSGNFFMASRRWGVWLTRDSANSSFRKIRVATSEGRKLNPAFELVSL